MAGEQFIDMNYYVYMLLCADGSYYIGVTNNLELRVAEHEAGWNPSSYTHERRPVRLVYSEDFQRIEQAIAWEKQIKGWSRAKKAALAEGDWQRIKSLARASESRPSTSSSFDKLRMTEGGASCPSTGSG